MTPIPAPSGTVLAAVDGPAISRRAVCAAAATLLVAGVGRSETPSSSGPAKPHGPAQGFSILAIAIKETGAQGGLAAVAEKLPPAQRPILQRLIARMDGNDAYWQLFFRNSAVYIGNMASSAPAMGFYDPLADTVLLLIWRRGQQDRWSLQRAAMQPGAAFRAEADATRKDQPRTWLAEAVKGEAPAHDHLKRAAHATAQRFGAVMPLNGSAPISENALGEPDAALHERYEYISAGLVEIGTEFPQIVTSVSVLQALLQGGSPEPFAAIATPETVRTAQAIRGAIPKEISINPEPALAVIESETGTGFVALSDSRLSRFILILYVDVRKDHPIGGLAAVHVP